MKPPDKKPITTNRLCPYLGTVYSLKNLFTPDECKQIINTALNDWKEDEGVINNFQDKQDKVVENLDYRNTTLFIPPEPDELLFSKIVPAIIDLNSSDIGYQFHVQRLMELPNLLRYQAADIDKHGKPGQYNWHMDIGPDEITSRRKISYSILLNPNEYEGGELSIGMSGGTLDSPFPDQDGIGTMITFPSYLLHKVSPVTSGTRYAIVGWAHGNSFI